MGTGGKPGITFKASIILEENDGRVLVFPSIQDKNAVFNYLKEYQTGEFAFHATPLAADAHGDSSGSENQRQS